MAIKSKAKSGVRNKKSKRKTPVKKKPARHGGKAGLTLGIGIVSTIAVKASLQTAFKNGLGKLAAGLTVVNAQSYAADTIEQKIQKFNSNAQIGLIITVGGIRAARAAEAAATKPFLSLVGEAPSTLVKQCYGGVSLQSYRSDPLRIEHLVQMGFAEDEIGLFYNPNSAMADLEIAAWTGATPPIAGGVNAAGHNDSSAYAGDFAGLPGTLKALVISADPFFQDTKNALVKAANDSGLHICYPLQDYAAATPQPAPNKATLYGPALADAYALLGTFAANVLNNVNKTAFSAPLNTVKDL